MSLKEMRQKYGDDARFLVIDPERLGFIHSTLVERDQKRSMST